MNYTQNQSPIFAIKTNLHIYLHKHLQAYTYNTKRYKKKHSKQYILNALLSPFSTLLIPHYHLHKHSRVAVPTDPRERRSKRQWLANITETHTKRTGENTHHF